MSEPLEHLRLAASELYLALGNLQRIDVISDEEWPAVSAALLDIRHQLAAIDLRLEGK